MDQATIRVGRCRLITEKALRKRLERLLSALAFAAQYDVITFRWLHGFANSLPSRQRLEWLNEMGLALLCNEIAVRDSYLEPCCSAEGRH